MLLDPDLVPQPSKEQVGLAGPADTHTAGKKKGRAGASTNAPPKGVDPDTWYDRKLAICVLNEGLRLLDGKVTSPI